jgi:predicted nucleic acid-binding protein
VKIVIGTNIIFSVILSPDGTISDLLLNSFEVFDFYAPSSILDELKNHQDKIRQLTDYSQDDLVFLKRILFKKIEFIDIENIDNITWEAALQLTNDVDEYDAPFVALSMELDAPLWTGDKKTNKGTEKKRNRLVVYIRENKRATTRIVAFFL